MYQSLKKSLARLGGEQGTSLLSVMIGVGLLSMAALILMNGLANDRSEAEMLRARRSVRDIEASLRVYLWDQVKSHAAAGCSKEKFIDLMSNQKIGATAIPRLALGAIPTEGSAPDIHKDAARRCANPVIPTSTGSSFHFCLYIESLEKDEERGSFLTGNQPFAEVYVKLRHPTDNTAASCSELAFSATTTASIYYGIYWSRGKVATGLDYGRYLGAFDASR